MTTPTTNPQSAAEWLALLKRAQERLRELSRRWHEAVIREGKPQ